MTAARPRPGSPAILIRGGVRRHGHVFVPAVVRALVPRMQIGVYLLVRNRTPVYVGRSDTCLRRRLGRHPLLGRASHFYWEPCASAALAFAQEAAWYHQLRDSAAGRNLIHPARPPRHGRPCPFCARPNGKDTAGAPERRPPGGGTHAPAAGGPATATEESRPRRTTAQAAPIRRAVRGGTAR